MTSCMWLQNKALKNPKEFLQFPKEKYDYIWSGQKCIIFWWRNNTQIWFAIELVMFFVTWKCLRHFKPLASDSAIQDRGRKAASNVTVPNLEKCVFSSIYAIMSSFVNSKTDKSQLTSTCFEPKSCGIESYDKKVSDPVWRVGSHFRISHSDDNLSLKGLSVLRKVLVFFSSASYSISILSINFYIRIFEGHWANLWREVSKCNNSLTFYCKNSEFRHLKGAEKVACLPRSDLMLCWAVWNHSLCLKRK